jgi:hypothetical protein
MPTRFEYLSIRDFDHAPERAHPLRLFEKGSIWQTLEPIIELAGHEFLISDFSTGRGYNQIERLMFSAATRDPVCADHVLAFGVWHPSAPTTSFAWISFWKPSATWISAPLIRLLLTNNSPAGYARADDCHVVLRAVCISSSKIHKSALP